MRHGQVDDLNMTIGVLYVHALRPTSGFSEVIDVMWRTGRRRRWQSESYFTNMTDGKAIFLTRRRYAES